jgi:hypothetical protein
VTKIQTYQRTRNTGDFAAAVYSNPLLEAFETILVQMERFKARAKAYYYEVLLSRYSCPDCGGNLRICSPCRWACDCGRTIDPTVVFQKSPCCHASLVKKTCHYVCACCRKIVPSRFLFDERVFDSAYFRERMARSRDKAKARREEMKRLLAASRSGRFDLDQSIDLDAVPGLVETLNQFVREPAGSTAVIFEIESGFDLDEYQRHIMSLLSWDPVNFSDLKPMIDDLRRDRVRRFVALVFMEHQKEVELDQDGDEIWIRRVYHEIDD